MKKIMILAASAAVAILSGYMGFKANTIANESSDLTLADVEAQTGWIEDYWNRLDYNCVDIDCYYLLMKYEGTAAQFVGEGCGSEPHSWCCPGCNYNYMGI